MRAAQINEYGGADVVETVTDATKPAIESNQVLIEVSAAGVNPFDWKVREGMAKQMAELTFPAAVLGGDLAGKVAEVGADVTHVKVGDEVFGLAGALSSHGSFAEFAPVAGAQIARKPKATDFVQSAALPLVSVSAYQALVEVLQLSAGQKILIHGGAGGIGSVAIQLAKHLGAHVATTASGSGVEFAKRLGADEIIDYTQQSFKDELSGYDAVFDTVGGDTFTDSFEVLRLGGVIVSMSAKADPELDQKFQVTSHGIFTQATTERLAAVAALVDEGVINVHVDRVFPLDQAAEALEYLKTGHPQGKIVIQIKG